MQRKMKRKTRFITEEITISYDDESDGNDNEFIKDNTK